MTMKNGEVVVILATNLLSHDTVPCYHTTPHHVITRHRTMLSHDTVPCYHTTPYHVITRHRTMLSHDTIPYLVNVGLFFQECQHLKIKRKCCHGNLMLEQVVLWRRYVGEGGEGEREEREEREERGRRGRRGRREGGEGGKGGENW